MTQSPYRSGFIAIVGRTNVGKSTLMNALIGEKVAIVADRPQTTRFRIRGVLTRSAYQMVFIDTPGMHTPKNQLSRMMVASAQGSLQDVDAALVVVDAAAGIGPGDERMLQIAGRCGAPVVVAVNKTDALSHAQLGDQLAKLAAMLPESTREVLPVSARTGENLPQLESILRELLPEGPQYYPEDMMTDQPEYRMAAEAIREKALTLLSDEVPHGIGVDVTRMRPGVQGKLVISACIYCERETHKGIIIGKNGAMLKKIGSQARVDLEDLLGEPVYLDLWVKVSPGWRDNAGQVRSLGYIDEEE